MEDFVSKDLCGCGKVVSTTNGTNTFTLHTILLVRKQEKSKGGGVEQIGRSGRHIQGGRAMVEADTPETEEIINWRISYCGSRLHCTAEDRDDAGGRFARALSEDN